MPKPIRIARVLFRHPKKGFLLVQKRSKHDKLKHYKFPGGKARKGERLLQAARRELREETGLMAQNLHAFSITTIVKPNKPSRRTTVFVADRVHGSPKAKHEILRVLFHHPNKKRRISLSRHTHYTIQQFSRRPRGPLRKNPPFVPAKKTKSAEKNTRRKSP